MTIEFYSEPAAKEYLKRLKWRSFLVAVTRSAFVLAAIILLANSVASSDDLRTAIAGGDGKPRFAATVAITLGAGLSALGVWLIAAAGGRAWREAHTAAKQAAAQVSDSPAAHVRVDAEGITFSYDGVEDFRDWSGAQAQRCGPSIIVSRAWGQKQYVELSRSPLTARQIARLAQRRRSAKRPVTARDTDSVAQLRGEVSA